MGLLIQPPPFHALRVNNRNSTPAATEGVSLTTGISGAMGSWVEVLSAAQITADLDGFHFMVTAFNAGATINRTLLIDLGIDPAGGTSYTRFCTLNAGNAAGSLIGIGGGREYFLPYRIPKDASFGARGQTGHSASGSVAVVAHGYGQKGQGLLKTGQYAEDIGLDSANSRGTLVTPGNATFGSYVSLGTLARPCWWFNVGFGYDDTSVTATYTHVELSFGDVSNKHVFWEGQCAGNTSEHVGETRAANVDFLNCLCPLPAGAELFARAKASGAPDSNFHVSVVGIG